MMLAPTEKSPQNLKYVLLEAGEIVQGSKALALYMANLGLISRTHVISQNLARKDPQVQKQE